MIGHRLCRKSHHPLIKNRIKLSKEIQNVSFRSNFKNETYGDGDIVVGEDEGGVDAGEFGVRHFVGVVETGWSCKSPILTNFGPWLNQENKHIRFSKPESALLFIG